MRWQQPSDETATFDPSNAVTSYGGYRIELKLRGFCGTYRVRRDDGSWRYTPPSAAGPYYPEWVVVRPMTAGQDVELEVFASIDAAKRWIDAQKA